MEDNSINPGLEANQIVSPENKGMEPPYQQPVYSVEPEEEPESKKVAVRDEKGHFLPKK